MRSAIFSNTEQNMVRNSLALVPILVVVLAAGCSTGRRQPDVTVAPDPPANWAGQLAGEVTASSRLLGQVRLEPRANGVMQVFIELRSVRHPSRFPWVILAGSCGEINATEVSPRAVPEVESRPDGTASLSTAVKVNLEPGRSYHLAIIQSRTNPDAVIGCAPLTAFYR